MRVQSEKYLPAVTGLHFFVTYCYVIEAHLKESLAQVAKNVNHKFGLIGPVYGATQESRLPAIPNGSSGVP